MTLSASCRPAIGHSGDVLWHLGLSPHRGALVRAHPRVRRSAWIGFAALLCVTELSITCGYHRLFSHATYQAHPTLKVIFLLFGAMALQNSALVWSAAIAYIIVHR